MTDESAALPGISWWGTCVKLKPLATQASLTSLQFRALKSALAATQSSEKVQMKVSKLSIVGCCGAPLPLQCPADWYKSVPPPAVAPQVIDE